MGKHCPYCGRRISYFTTFHEKKRGIHTCTRCKKESKIKTDLRLIVAFIAVVLLVIMFIIVWSGSGNYNNFLGVIITAVILLVFYFLTPLFVRFIPLKKYMEESPVREEYEYEYEYEPDYDYEYDDDIPELGEDEINKEYTFNRDIFDEIKERRNSTIARNNAENSDNIEHTKIADKNYVPIINDVTEAHASSSNEPLKKVKTPSYSYPNYESYENFDDEPATYHKTRKKNNRPDGSKYTANRKF